MAGDEANRKNSNSSRVELQMEMEMTIVQDLNIYKSASNSSEPSNHIDSEVDSEAADPEDDNEYMYSRLNGDSDIENDISNSSDESIALLVHEITCCECETDTETDSDEVKDNDNNHANVKANEVKNSYENAKEITNENIDNASDELGINQNIQNKDCLHNPYKLMADDEDDELNNDTDDDNDDASETLLLLGEDQESENYDLNALIIKFEKPDKDDNSGISRN